MQYSKFLIVLFCFFIVNVATAQEQKTATFLKPSDKIEKKAVAKTQSQKDIKKDKEAFISRNKKQKAKAERKVKEKINHKKGTLKTRQAYELERAKEKKQKKKLKNN